MTQTQLRNDPNKYLTNDKTYFYIKIDSNIIGHDGGMKPQSISLNCNEQTFKDNHELFNQCLFDKNSKIIGNIYYDTGILVIFDNNAIINISTCINFSLNFKTIYKIKKNLLTIETFDDQLRDSTNLCLYNIFYDEYGNIKSTLIKEQYKDIPKYISSILLYDEKMEIIAICYFEFPVKICNNILFNIQFHVHNNIQMQKNITCQEYKRA